MAGKGVIANNYGSLDAVFTSGSGSTLTDINGKKYIDFVSGIGVNCLGHNHPALVKAVTEQAVKQIHISNYYNSDTGLAFADNLIAEAGLARVFFGNSGAEANESAIKIARKYGYLQTQAAGSGAKARNVIVTLEKSFHGRTVATLSATGQTKFHPDCFAPYPAGFRHIKAGDYDALKSIDETVCAVLIECVQGEGGVNLIDAKFAKALEEAAHKAGALFMVDEVQTGVGRTGSYFASKAMGLNPDVITLAKGIAGGIPMGACLFGGKAVEVFAAGDHQSTFGGNPLACAAGLAVLKELSAPGFMKRVTDAGEKIRSTISSWKLKCVTEVRGRGLMIGIDITGSAAEVQKKCLENGLCISTAGPNTVRFLPPLVITDSEIEKGLSVFLEILKTI